MATVRELITKIGYDIDDNKLDKAEKAFQKFKRGAKIGAGIAVAGLAAIGIGAVKAAADMEMLTTQFEVMLGSTDAAISMMEQLKQFSAATPFQLKDLAQGTQTLLSFGVAQKDVLNTMRMLGDSAGGNQEKLNGLVLAYGKVQTKGKASMEEINMIAERGIPIIGTLTKQLGVTEKEFFKLVSAGKIGRAEITNAFKSMTSEGGIFFQGMEKASLTLTGLISTMKDNFNLLLGSIGEGLLPSIKEFVGVITALAKGPLKELGAGLTSVLVPIFKALTPILEKVIKFLVPILEIVGKILGMLLQGLLPVFDLLEPLLELLMELMPVLEVLVELIILLIPPTVFILKIAIKLLILIAKWLQLVAKWVRLLIKFWTGVGKVILGVGSAIRKALIDPIKRFFNMLKDIKKRVTQALDPILAPIRNMINKIGGFFDDMWNRFAKSVNKAIEMFNKISPGEKFDIKGRLSTIDSAKEKIQSEVDKSQRTVNIQQQTNLGGVSVGAGAGAGAGMTAGAVGKAVGTAVRAEFAKQVKKVLISAV
jgi:tape measure domain-containing protein